MPRTSNCRSRKGFRVKSSRGGRRQSRLSTPEVQLIDPEWHVRGCTTIGVEQAMFRLFLATLAVEIKPRPIGTPKNNYRVGPMIGRSDVNSTSASFHQKKLTQ
jgi:hypothetical protein